MPAIPYTKNPPWADGSGGGTSIDAADLNVLEAGIHEVSYAPAVRAWAGATTNCTTATWTSQALNSEDFDQVANAASTMHDLVTNNTRLTCRYAGIYLIIGHGAMQVSAAGTLRQIRIFQDGTTEIAQGASEAPSAAAQLLAVSTLRALSVNQYVELQVFQNSGGTLTFSTSGFQMVRVA